MFIVWQRPWRRSCQITLNNSEASILGGWPAELCVWRALAGRARTRARPTADNHMSTEPSIVWHSNRG